MGPDGTPVKDAGIAGHVQTALHDADFRQARSAIQALVALDRTAAVAALADGVRHTDALVRRRAAQALGKLGAAGADVVEHLLALARDSGWTVREAAVLALAEQPASNPVVRGALTRAALHDASPLVRAAAAQAAILHGTEPVADVGPSLQHPHAAVRRRGVQVLAQYPSATPGILPLLLATLEDSHVKVRRAAAEAVGSQDAVSAIPRLLRCACDGDPRVSRSATAALRRLLTLPAAASLRWLDGQAILDVAGLLETGLSRPDVPAAALADFQAACLRRQHWHERVRGNQPPAEIAEATRTPWAAAQSAMDAAGDRQREAAWLLSWFCELWLRINSPMAP